MILGEGGVPSRRHGHAPTILLPQPLQILARIYIDRESGNSIQVFLRRCDLVGQCGHKSLRRWDVDRDPLLTHAQIQRNQRTLRLYQIDEPLRMSSALYLLLVDVHWKIRILFCIGAHETGGRGVQVSSRITHSGCTVPITQPAV